MFLEEKLSQAVQKKEKKKKKKSICIESKEYKRRKRYETVHTLKLIGYTESCSVSKQIRLLRF